MAMSTPEGKGGSTQEREGEKGGTWGHALA